MLENNQLLETAIIRCMETVEEQFIQEIIKKDCDYYLSMQSFYEAGNPYKNKNLNSLLVAYMVARNEGNETKSLLQIPLINIKTEKVKDEECSYLKVLLSGIDEDDIFREMKVKDPEKTKTLYKEMLKKINVFVNGDLLAQGNFIVLHNQGIPEEVLQYLNLLQEEVLTPMQKTLIDVSTSLINRVPYQWGGKANHAGYDNNWYTLNENGEQKGLDCSGYIQWVLRTAGAKEEIWKEFTILGSLEKYEKIEKENLEIGDIGILHDGSKDVVNHVGMYMGDGRWIHCSSGQNTVVLVKTDMFTEYVRLPYMNLEIKEEDKESLKANPGTGYAEEDIYLLAQLIHHEAAGEGLNGWIAVAEIIKNRILSDAFPTCTNIRNTIFKKGEFENVEQVTSKVPTKEEIMVAKEVMAGNLQILNNPSVLFYKNNGGKKEDWGKYPYYTTINNHQFYLLTKKGEGNYE